MKIIVLGGGLVGGPMAIDLAADSRFEVTVADIDRAALHRLNGIERLTPIAADLRAAEMVRRLAEAFRSGLDRLLTDAAANYPDHSAAVFGAVVGSRVLGQYDIAMLSAEQEPGRLLYVEENIRATARMVGVPLDDFRLWVALHESTHAFEFEAHPWLRPYLRERMERQVALFARETRRLQRHGLAHLARRWRSAARIMPNTVRGASGLAASAAIAAWDGSNRSSASRK